MDRVRENAMNAREQKEGIELRLAEREISLREAVALIPRERLRKILELRLGLRGASLTYNEIGCLMSLSRQRVHQLAQEALENNVVTRSSR